MDDKRNRLDNNNPNKRNKVMRTTEIKIKLNNGKTITRTLTAVEIKAPKGTTPERLAKAPNGWTL